MTAPAVSVVTATHNRHATLIRAMRSLAAQTFTDWEHVIVADGPDPRAARLVAVAAEALEILHDRPYRHRVVELGRNWHEATGKANYGAPPRLVGTHLAAGDYLCYLDDDNEFLPNHLADLSAALDAGGCDVAFGTCQIVSRDGEEIEKLGDGTVQCGHIDTGMVMHKFETLLKANWRATQYADDWQLFEAWAKAGLTFKFIDKTVMRYYRR